MELSYVDFGTVDWIGSRSW